jgi:hypothetical protein
MLKRGARNGFVAVFALGCCLRQRIGRRFSFFGSRRQAFQVFLGLLRFTAVDFKLKGCDIHMTPIKKAPPKWSQKEEARQNLEP